jgi:two-component system NtrC family sensor kinase
MLDIFDYITPSYLIYLFYGATFLFLGVSIAAKDMRGSDLRLANGLWLLAVFGFLHGLHEWIELGILIEGEHLVLRQIFMIKAVSILLVLLSFVFLMQFGISLLWDAGDKRIWLYRTIIPAPLLLLWSLHVWYFGFRLDTFDIDMQTLRQAGIGARYTFGFVGGLMTAYGLYVNSREVKTMSRSASNNLFFAGITFGCYALFAGIFSFKYTLPFTPVPVVVFRGISGLLITYFIAKALNIFDIEMRIKYDRQTKAMAQTEKLTSIGRLAAGVAHEINNPLTSASLGIQTLMIEGKSSGLDNAVVEKLEAIERSIDKAAVIAADLLQFSRQKELKFAPANIRDSLSGALTLLDYRLKNINVQLDSSDVPMVYGDRSKLEQVFVNILSNSVDAMPEGGKLDIETSQRNGTVVVRISDSGIGIAKENVPKVFDPFFTTKGFGKGTGLGLAICYGIIREHHGTIELSSEGGKGTQVTVTLPTMERYRELYEKNTRSR